jgi:dihydroorotate dehydrogenase
MLPYCLLKPFVFALDPETAHEMSIAGMKALGTLLPAAKPLPGRRVAVMGLDFPNPVGMAAGLDKNGDAIDALAGWGWGFLEIGTVTPRPQPGNPKPRLFRLPEDQALINRMGFPGKGADFVLQRLGGRKFPGLVLGVNLGKNKDTPLESAGQDYLVLMRKFADVADYLAINVSSPNTAGLRRLQARELLGELLDTLVQERTSLSGQYDKQIPLLLKLAPDLNEGELEDAVGVAIERGMDGLIATNTTIERHGLRSARAGETGGLSGAPLNRRSLELTRRICSLAEGRLPVISVGGILSPADAQERLDAGAALVQVYTGLIYAGPGLVRQIVNALY